MSTTTPAARVTHSHTIMEATAAVAGQAAVLQGKDLFQFCSHLELTSCTQQFFPDACIYMWCVNVHHMHQWTSQFDESGVNETTSSLFSAAHSWNGILHWSVALREKTANTKSALISLKVFAITEFQMISNDSTFSWMSGSACRLSKKRSWNSGQRWPQLLPKHMLQEIKVQRFHMVRQCEKRKGKRKLLLERHQEKDWEGVERCWQPSQKRRCVWFRKHSLPRFSTQRLFWKDS